MSMLVLLLLTFSDPSASEKHFPSKVREAILDATVLLLNDTTKQRGSGVIIKQSRGFVYVLTAGHLVDKEDKVRLGTTTAATRPRSAKTYSEVEVLASSRSPDLAVLRLRTEDRMPGVASLCSVRSLPEGKPAVLSVGFPERSTGPLCQEPRLLGVRRVIKPGESQARRYWQTEKPPVKGESGGPMIDLKGQVIGIASGMGDEKGYFTHPEEIHSFLARQGLRWLYE